MGARYLAQPSAAGHTWVGRRQARGAPVRLFVRTHGARDVALALGGLTALRRPPEARRWMLAQAIADAADLAATVAAKDRLASGPRRIGLVAAGVSTAVALASAALLREDGATP